MRKMRLISGAIAVFGISLALSMSARAENVAIDAKDSAGAALTGDPEHGKALFKQCQTCHFLEKGKNFTGPSLFGVIGRKAGTVEGYVYSKGNKESGKVWSEQTIFEYLEDPRKAVPGTKMSFPGLKKPQDRADVIAFLQANGGMPPK